MALLRANGHKIRPSTRFKVKVPDKQVDQFYNSPEWRKLCAEIRFERWPMLLHTKGHCCEDQECKAMHSTDTRIYFDHIKERRDRPDLALVKSNIMGRCGASHTRKTAQERARRLGLTR